MSHRTLAWLVPLVLVTLSSPFAQARVAPASTLPRNFHEVESGLYRGGKIESEAQLRLLRDTYGVRTVVCLAKDSLGPEGANEFAWGKQLGVKVIKSYLYDVGPKPAQWTVIRQAMVDKHAYVHCKWGADRTGAVVAKYREEVEGWNARRAFTEARRYDFNPRLEALRRWIDAPADMK